MMMRPLDIADDDSPLGPRIGGAAPAGMEAEFRDEHVQYFGTFPLVDDEREFSVFHAFDISGEDAERDIILHNNQILEPSPLIRVVVHERSARADSSPRMFTGRRLIVGDPQPDILDDPEADEDEPASCSKLSGRCYVERHHVLRAVRDLESQGFVHLLQIGLDGETIIDDFPWDPGYLNVWARDPSDPATYRFCIQQ